MTIAHEGSSGIETVGTAKGVSSTTVAWTNVAAGRLALLFCTIKLGSALFPAGPPTGFTWLVDVTGGTGTTAADAGTTRLGVWYKVMDGSETGNISLSAAASESMAGGLSVYSTSQGAWEVPIAVTGNDTTHATTRSNVCGAWPSTLAAGDLAVWAYASDTDADQTFTSHAITQTGATFGTINQRNERLSTSGNDSGLYTFDASVSTGSANAPTISFTGGTANCGPAAVIRLREDPARSVAPTLINEQETTWNSTAASKTFTATWQTGDNLIVAAVSADGATTIGTPTATGLTFLPIDMGAVGAAGASTFINRWYAKATSPGTGVTITVPRIGGTDHWGAQLWIWRGSDGIGSSTATAAAPDNVKVQTLTRMSPESAVIAVLGDWGAGSPASPTWTPTGQTQRVAHDGAGVTYSVLIADWPDENGLGSTSYGITAGLSTGRISRMILEVLGTAGSGISQNVLQVTETDIAQPIGRSKLRAIGQVVETVTARPIIPTKSRTVNQATNSNIAQPIGKAKSKAFAQATETDLAQAIRPTRLVALNRATETDTARPVIFTKARALAQISETDTARPVVPTKSRLLGRVTETDLARLLTPTRFIPVNRVTETDTARAITFTKLLAFGRVTETDIARSAVSTKARLVAMVVETDIARAIARAKARAIGQVTETDIARALAHIKARQVGQVTETDVAQNILKGGSNILVNQVIETDIARVIARIKTKSFGQVTETDVARAIVETKSRTIGRVTDTQVARAMTATHARSMGFVTDISIARTIAPRKQKGILVATETDVARVIQLAVAGVVGRVTETDVARAIAKAKTRSFGQVTEANIARALTVATTVTVNRVTETDIAVGLTERLLLGIVVETNIAGEVVPVLGAGGVLKSPITLLSEPIGVSLTGEDIGVAIYVTPTGLVLVEREPIAITVKHGEIGITLRS